MSNSENKASGNALLKTTLITLVAAVIVTVLFVMPAEFGIDPTGVGAKLGLLDLSAIDASQEQSDESRALIREFRMNLIFTNRTCLARHFRPHMTRCIDPIR